MKKQKFTGRSRRKKTRLSVRLADLFAERLITIGGIGTIVAVCLVFVFLFFVVAPLFQSAQLSDTRRRPAIWSDQPPVRVVVDEYRTMGWGLHADGSLDIFRLDTGEVLEQRQLFPEAQVTAVGSVIGRDDLAIGFADGSVRFGRIGFESQFREASEVTSDVAALPAGGVAEMDGGMVQRTPQNQFRLQRLVTQFQPPLQIADRAVRAIDHVPPDADDNPLSSKEYRFVALSDDGRLRMAVASESQDLFSGESSLEISRRVELPEVSAAENSPAFLLMSGRGDNVFLASEDGSLFRFDTRDLNQVELVERVALLPADGSRLTACQFLLGRETILCGDDQGRLRAWFRTRVPGAASDASSGVSSEAAGEVSSEASGGDGFRLTMAHELPAGDSAITTLNSSKRNRMVAVGYASGRMRVFQVTTAQQLLEQAIAADRPVRRVVITPKDDGLVAMTDTQLWTADFDPGHPEATLAALFRPVWYEGYERPIHMWQSSFAGVGPEMKLGLWPLVFGTLKATAYTMMFGAPLALLAAIYTSEFLGSSLRSRIKPAIEMMASLPSVVLGFLAALVFAPYVESVVPAALAMFFTVPVSFLLGAMLWQMLPYRWQLSLRRYRFLALCLVAPLGVAAAFRLGPWMERLLFAGDIKRWLDGQIGTGTAAWLILLLPLTALAMVLLVGMVVNPRLRRWAGRLSRGQFVMLNTAKLMAATMLTFLVAYLVSSLLTTLGAALDIPLDPRGSYVATYEQRNALVVGFVMGFAVIPIIYTIADDALTTVPSHLRSASLGCGATPWQTAVRVVIPTAMSGLFSALMIGLGRAVGETMIVLMAGGNTPVTDWNIFSGFRTLSANIAVELPEAVRNSTHYRTLFLAALTLFLLTFVVNTAAEVVRLRFRRRAYQL